MPPSLSIIIPVLNEEEEIGRILTAARDIVTERGTGSEVIVVDNASTDRTRERAEPFVDGDRVRLLRNEVNRGKGYSIRRGMLEATGDLRLMCDADCAASLPSLPHLEEATEEVHVAVGSRSRGEAHVARQQPIRRRIVGAGFLAYTRLAIGKLPSDVYCGFKLWRSEAAEAVFGRAVLDGWAFDAEALAMAKALGYSLREVGIEWSNRPDSRLSIRSVLLPVTRELLVARRNIHRAVGATTVAGAEPSLVSPAETG